MKEVIWNDADKFSVKNDQKLGGNNQVIDEDVLYSLFSNVACIFNFHLSNSREILPTH